MKSLFNNSDASSIISRIAQLKPDSERQWGKMNIAQMLAHCNATMEMATGRLKHKRLLLGRILGPLVKKDYLSEKPFPKNSPTDKNFMIADERVFEDERNKLTGLVKEFADGGEAKCTTHPHSFFGSLTAEQWGTSMYKHLDHHLKQFSN